MTHKPELYISVDVETSGPIPGEFSLLSLGACVVGQPSKTFYAELKPLNDNFDKKALEVSDLSMEELRIKGEKPAEAFARFEKWIKEVSGENRPIFVAFNATFDWMFTHWYFIRFLGHDPFGISGLDIKAYFMGKHKALWGETVKKKVRLHYPPKTAHTHNALDDAIEQAEIFEKMLKLVNQCKI
ncbi:MAG: 3'-5' exonuclease [Candidatus Omnitrophica bacterium]|nr:3'-5' exonuclease [Candidatus Omnitrophota bacterium]